MCLVTKLLVEGSNPVRELAKFFSNPGVEHWKAVEKFAGCLKSKEDDIKLTHRKPKELPMVSSVDSNYATDKENRGSVSGNLHTMGGMIANWLCNSQGCVLVKNQQVGARTKTLMCVTTSSESIMKRKTSLSST
jgi:hypothetical protein